MADVKTKSANSVAPLTAGAFEKYSAALHRYLLKRLGRPEDASDLMQEIFERFFKKRTRAEVIRNPLSYLFGIASHVVSEARYAEQQSPLAYDSELVERLTDIPDEASQDELGRQLDLRRALLGALSALPENHLLAVLLVVGEGMSYQEAAQVSGFTRSTIATYVMHARAKLKLILEDDWGGKESSR